MKSLIRPVSASQIVIETRRRARFPSGRGKTCTFDWKSWKRRQNPSFSDVQKTTISGRDRQKLPKWSQMSCVYRFLLWIEPCCQIGEKSWFWHWSTMVAKMCSKSIKFLLILLRNHVFPLRSHDFALEIWQFTLGIRCFTFEMHPFCHPNPIFLPWNAWFLLRTPSRLPWNCSVFTCNSPFSLRKAKFKIWKPKNPKNEKRKTSKTEIPKAETHKKLWRKNSKTNFSCCSPSFSLPLGAFSPMLTPTRLIRWTPLWTLPGFRGTRKPALDKPIIDGGVFRRKVI